MKSLGIKEEKKCKILLADADPAAAAMIFAYFSNRGHDVLAVKDAAELLISLGDGFRGTVIVDALFCPGNLGGLITAARKRSPGARIILTSGSCGLDAITAARGAGIAFHAQKPLDFAELENAVNQKGGY